MTGIPAEAFEFYEHLDVDNSREFWIEHKSEYEQYVRDPLHELAQSLEPDFGPAKLYRPYRDMRFSRDKTPYKDHQGCFFAADNGLGWYLQVSAHGLMVAGGWYSSSGPQVKRFREHITEAGAGDIRAALKGLPKAGFTIDGEQLKSRPRGIDADHPDLDLLRHRTLHATKTWEPEAWMGTKRLRTTVHKSLDKLRPMVVTLAQIVGPPE
ncbi:MAG TPA: DUF2461 domain-containing protein [Actinomycetota bacterium]|nr:DUF2461 domain-containing protein [Actinomycetota bacterium]